MGRILILGANRGTGLEMTRQLAERGEQVLAVCRRSSSELNTLATEANVTIREKVDVTDRDSLLSLAASLPQGSLDKGNDS